MESVCVCVGGALTGNLSTAPEVILLKQKAVEGNLKKLSLFPTNSECAQSTWERFSFEEA